ncbi:MAG TPA: hypothetical protein VFA09_17270 [Ktedonobacteraceae bacterium]|nr:hypothetical protein [Ktedonobacteraceae bacterium]
MEHRSAAHSEPVSSSSARYRAEILAPTFLEYWAVRSVLPPARASWSGVRLMRWKGALEGSIVVVSGLAGALAPGIPPGTVLIPDWIGLADGSSMRCDPALVKALLKAARTLHFQPDSGPLLTAPSMILGSDRNTWSQKGFVAADMETGLLAGRNLRVATIRVVLDAPERGISSDWLRPTKAMLQPKLWKELFWLSWAAPRYALRAARVLKVALCDEPGNTFAE